MKKIICLTVAAVLLLSCMSGVMWGKEKPRIGVLRFTNHTSAGWWSASVADELSDMLASEMVSTEAFQVLERKELNAVLSEQDLGASGRISSSTKAKMKKIKGAKYLIAGTVSAYEENTKGMGGGVSLGPVSLGGKKQSAYMAVDVKVIDTDTGEIADARTIEATAQGSALGAGLSLSNFSIHGGGYEKTPTGKAIRACIVYICEYLECSMTKGKNDDCMDKWREMESKRKKKTKDSISLD